MSQTESASRNCATTTIVDDAVTIWTAMTIAERREFLERFGAEEQVEGIFIFGPYASIE